MSDKLLSFYIEDETSEYKQSGWTIRKMEAKLSLTHTRFEYFQNNDNWFMKSHNKPKIIMIIITIHISKHLILLRKLT